MGAGLRPVWSLLENRAAQYQPRNTQAPKYLVGERQVDWPAAGCWEEQRIGDCDIVMTHLPSSVRLWIDVSSCPYGQGLSGGAEDARGDSELLVAGGSVLAQDDLRKLESPAQCSGWT